MNIWFISDTHFGHNNILKYCKRPFSSIEEMDSTIIKNWNERIKEDDLVFFLGDFCFGKSTEAPGSKGFDYYRNQLNGNIIFLRGNHDKNNRCKSIIESIIINYGGKRIYLTHNPKFYCKDFKFNFTGHTHGIYGKFKRINKSVIVDLSVDCWSFRPVSINEINQAYSIWCKNE